MLAKRIIACLDCKDGVVIKGVKFQAHQVVGDIFELSQRYSDEGIDELVLYDITASSDRRVVDTNWIKKISRSLRIPFAVAGGIHSLEKAEHILNSGAEKISINSPAIEHPDLINLFAKHFGTQAVVVGIDTQKVNGIDKIYKYTGDIRKTIKSEKTLFSWIKEVEDRGAGEIVINSIQSDGMKQGYDLDLLERIKKTVSIPVIASGGAGTMQHFADVFLQSHIDGALAASVFHTKSVPVDELKYFLKQKGIHVRL